MNVRTSSLELVFTDVDGVRYYVDQRGDIVDHNGQLVSLTAEWNIRQTLSRFGTNTNRFGHQQ